MTPTPVAEPNLGLLMFVSYRHLESRVYEAVVASGADDLTLAQARIFQRIGPAGTRVSELAEQARVTKQTAGFLVDQLERAGYVTRVPDPTDARARLVTIAERGAALIPVATTALEEVLAEWQVQLGAKRMRELVAALTKLREITDPYLT